MAMNLALKGQFIFTQPTVDNRNTVGTSNSTGGGCFHEDSLVLLHNKKRKRIKELLVGDKILTIDNNGTLVQDEVIAWIHQVKTGQYIFLQIVHDLGMITLTPEHIIFVGKSRNPQHASNLRPGDELSFFTTHDDRQTVTMAIVSSIHKVEGRGIYAPLTYSGRLLVDNVDVSCYCILNPLQAAGREIISSHTLAHAVFFPLRLAFKFGLNISSSEFIDECGIHSYARLLMNVILW
ncbi:desert hedgehog protein B-like [Mytilus trossulus]|uniref:desert hedgehog protein B-like n=1 Tax=Mytilus trossulus TaxID=6551 RepID=UPI003004B3BF